MADVAEPFLVRTEGGPCDGETRVANFGGSDDWTWPLPEVLPYDETGRYVKYSESDRPPQPEGSRVLRGAAYRWEGCDPHGD
jgi:hypothetical protein